MVCASARAVSWPRRPSAGWVELRVGVPPQLARVAGECDLAGGVGVASTLGAAAQAGAFRAGRGRRLRAAAEPGGRLQDAVEESVGDLDGGGVTAQFGLGDVPDDRDVRLGGTCGRGAGQQRERPTVPGRTQGRRQRRELAAGGLQHRRELGLDHEQSLVDRAGVRDRRGRGLSRSVPRHWIGPL